MSILNRLQGRSGGTIQVDVEPTRAGPGAEMTVRFSILDQFDEKARSVRAGVTCTGSYEVEEIERDKDGHETRRQVSRSVELFEHEQSVDLRTGEQRVTFLLPAHVQPTSGDVVTWAAWARVDRERGLDVVERVPFQVRVPLDRVPETRQYDATDDGLTLRGLPTAVPEDETVRGTLVVDVPDEVAARSVKVRLHRRVTYLARAENHYDVYSGSLGLGDLFARESRIAHDQQVAEVELGGRTTFTPGRPVELPFAIAVTGAGPTSSHLFAQVDWRVEAVLDRRLRGDKSVEAPIIVV